MDRLQKKHDDHKEDMKNHFDKTNRVSDLTDMLTSVQKDVRDLKEEFRKEFERVRKMDLGNLSDDTKSMMKALDGHKQDWSSSISALHKKHDEIKDIIGAASKRSEDGKKDISSMFDGLKTELGLHFDRVHSKVDNTKVDVDMQGVLRTLEAHKPKKGEDPFVNDAIAGIQKALKEHKEEMGSHFDKVHRKVDQGKVDIDLSSIMKALEMHKAELATINTVCRTIKDVPQQIGDVLRRIDQIAGVVEPHKGAVDEHMRKIHDQFKDIKDKHDDFSRQFDKLHRDKQDHHRELCSNIDKVQQNKGDSGIEQAINAVQKAMKDHREELSGHFARIHKKQDDHKEYLSGHLNDLSDRHAQFGKQFDEHQAQFGKHFDDLHRKHDEHQENVGKHMASVKRGLGENRVDRDLDAVLEMLKSQKSEMSNHFDSLHSKPDKSNYIEESINAVKKAIGDHQKEVAGHFDKLHSSRNTIDSVMGGLDKIERKVDLVREALPDLKLSQLEKIIKDHGVQENGVARGMDEVKRAINDLKRQKLAWVSGT